MKNKSFQPSDLELVDLAQKLAQEFDSKGINSNIDLMIKDNYLELVTGKNKDIDRRLFNHKNDATTLESDNDEGLNQDNKDIDSCQSFFKED